ncbi:MAG: histidine ammonia-lyase [Bacteroidetes bacterium]|nr:histidine ammonia-lyase [Bacteroidota bacterium]
MKNDTVEIGGYIKPAELFDLAQSGLHVALTDEAQSRTLACYTFVHDKIKRSDRPIYGVNTGFGSLCNTVINHDDLEKLQENLLLSHACGMGDEVPDEVVKLMLLTKVLSLSKGHSGVQPETIHHLMDLFNTNRLPVIYEQGSLGASGDLAPLAHLALPLIGRGTWKVDGHKSHLTHRPFPDFHLQAKEGLALINGTQFMLSYGIWCTVQAIRLTSIANQIAAMSADAFDCRIDPYLAQSHRIRNQKGQQSCAEELFEALQGSELISREKQHVQDPYSFRCVPQVHGASLDVFTHAERIFEDELNAVTDNPNVFPEDDLILSAGNFHGQPLALQLDAVAMGLAELASISERRIYKLISGERGLPAFLTPNPGLNSGFMIPQYTAASIVSQNKQLSTPASIDSIVSSNGQEDHVSMGANAATKCYRVLENAISVLSIELMCAAQALEMRRPAKSSVSLETIYSLLREHVPFISSDVYMHELMMKSREVLKTQLLNR